VHNGCVGMLAEARWYGMHFLVQAGTGESLSFRATADLLHAAACYGEIHDLMWKVWGLAGGPDNPQAWRQFARPDVRRQMADVLGEAERQDERATGHLEQALAHL
jgi:hypothetical protein